MRSRFFSLMAAMAATVTTKARALGASTPPPNIDAYPTDLAAPSPIDAQRMLGPHHHNMFYAPSRGGNRKFKGHQRAARDRAKMPGRRKSKRAAKRARR